MKRGFSIVELMIIVAIICILCGIAIPSILKSREFNSPEYKQQVLEQQKNLYKGWIKLHPTYENITFEEWYSLKEANLLPR